MRYMTGRRLGVLMMSRRRAAIRGTLCAATTNATVMGLILPVLVLSLLTGHLQIRRFHPTVTLTQCEDAGGVVEARARGGAVCIGGIDDADPVVGE